MLYTERPLQGSLKLSKLSNKIIVIGAISHPGFIVTSSLLHLTTKLDLAILEDESSIGFDSGTWSNRDKLRAIGIIPSIVDIGSPEVLQSHLEWLQAGTMTIVYIPSLLFNAIHTNSIFDVKHVTDVLKKFTNLLEIVKIHHGNRVKVVCFMPSGDLQSNRHSTMIKLFSMIATTYNNRNDIDVRLVTFSTTLCNFHNLHDDVLKTFQSILNDTHKNTNLTCTAGQPQLVNEATASMSSHSVVASTVFTAGTNSTYKNGSFNFMRGFYMTAAKQNLDMLIFHDEITLDFQNKLKNLHNQIDFVKVTTPTDRSPNDGRFYILYDYLLEHPEINWFVLQDIRDGTFHADPFKIMSVIGDVLYVGIDKAFYSSAFEYPWLRGSLYPQCFPHEIRKDEIKYHPFLNAGTIGGTRDVMLTFLTRLTQHFDKSPHRKNCDMAAVSVVTHKYFHNHTFSGYPFQAYFASGIGVPRGLAVRHKDTGYV